MSLCPKLTLQILACFAFKVSDLLVGIGANLPHKPEHPYKPISCSQESTPLAFQRLESQNSALTSLKVLQTIKGANLLACWCLLYLNQSPD